MRNVNPEMDGALFLRVPYARVFASVIAVIFICLAVIAWGCSPASSENGEDAQDAVAVDVESEEEAVPEDGVATPSTAGALQVVGSQLCGEDGNPVQLRGVSTHGLAWFPQYVNQQFFSELRNDWNANVVRLAMYTGESGGYCTDGDQSQLYDLVREGVSYATEADLYAVVDWHILSDGNPLQNADAAADFFARMSADLSQNNNVIYEICNEPNGNVTWPDVKSYAERIIPIIRANDPDAVIIVGTPTWSQDVDKAAADPLEAENVMYALHFYAATHQQDLRNKMTADVEAGLPVFVSEFGICDASGNGQIDYDSADAWVQLMDELNISYICWNLSNKNEASALFQASCNKTSGFDQDDLSAEGKWLMAVLHGEAPSDAGQNAAANVAAASGGSSAASVRGDLSGSNGELTWQANLSNSWESNGRKFCQYTVTITNNGATAVNGWEIVIPFDSAIELSDSWNGVYSANGTTLTIGSVDYNSNLSPNASIQDIGFIVSCSAL